MQIPQPCPEIAPPLMEEERDRVGGAAPQPGAHALDRGPAALHEQRISRLPDFCLAQPRPARAPSRGSGASLTSSGSWFRVAASVTSSPALLALHAR